MLSRDVVREQAGPTWGSARVDQIRQTTNRKRQLHQAQAVGAAAAAGVAAAAAAMAGSPVPPPQGLGAAASPADIAAGLS
jgi:hypothetical protein